MDAQVAPLEAGKGKDIYSLPEPPEGMQLC